MLNPIKQITRDNEKHIRAAIKANWKQKQQRRELRRELVEARG